MNINTVDIKLLIIAGKNAIDYLIPCVDKNKSKKVYRENYLTI